MADETLGERIRRLREARGMTHIQLAAACAGFGRRMARNDIWRYEAGIQDPGLRTFAALARALGVSLEVLYYGEEEAVRIAAERDVAGEGTESAGGWPPS